MSNYLGDCPKCGDTEVQSKYDRVFNRLERRCRGCGYTWTTPRIDAYPPAKELHESGYFNV
jgi:hypothetical protein